MKVLLISGHGGSNGSYDVGACSDYGIEATETRRVVAALKSQLGNYDVNVDVYPTNRNAYADIINGVLQVNFANYDYVLEIHFNSATNKSANGVEVWVTNAEKTITVEQSIVDNIAKIGYLNRGVKREDFCVIRTAKNKGVSSALLEVCFISNKDDMAKYNANFNKVCGAIVDSLVKGFSLKKINNKVEETPKPTVTEIPKVNYIVKTDEGKQLGAFSILDNAKNMASKNKAVVYDSKGKVIISYVPKVETGTRYEEKGTFYFSTAVTVRTKPEENAKTNVVYYVGDSVVYNHVILNKNGYNWIEYVRNNATIGYLKIKDLKTGESYGYAK